MNSRTTTRRLQVEALEDRACPSCSVMRLGFILHIRGDDLANTVHIRDHGSDVVVRLDGGPAATFAGVRVILVDTRGGDDLIDYHLEAPDAVEGARLLGFDLGAGADTARVAAGDAAAASALGGPLLLGLNGGGDADDLDVRVQNVARTAALTLAVDAGQGNDRVNLLVVEPRAVPPNPTVPPNPVVPPNPIVPLLVDVAGDDGDDDVRLRLEDISRIGPVFVGVRAGLGNDTADLSFSDARSPVDPCRALRVLIDGGDGNDRMGGTFRFIPTDPCRANLEVRGGRGDDALSLFVTGVSDFQQIRAVIDGGEGNDTAIASPGVQLEGTEGGPVVDA